MTMKASLVVPFINQDADKDGTQSGFYVTLPSSDMHPIIIMDPDIGLETAHKFWRAMGYQVSEIMNKELKEWLSNCPSTQDVMKSFTGFNEEIESLPPYILNVVDGDCDTRAWYTEEDGKEYVVLSEKEDEYISSELNKVFCKFSVSYKILSNILFFDPKRFNHIRKKVFEFVALKSEIEKISAFYRDNQAKFSIKPVEVGDISRYTLYNKSLEATVELTVED